jgi:ribosomal protein L18E
VNQVGETLSLEQLLEQNPDGANVRVIQ